MKKKTPSAKSATSGATSARRIGGTQNKNGNAFEYALANQLACAMGVRLKTRAKEDAQTDEAADEARRDFFDLPADFRRWLARAAEAAVSHVIGLEKQMLAQADDKHVQLLPDSAGIGGDPRDIILPIRRKHLAISAKLNNDTVKNPRLQFNNPDFADNWGLGARVSDAYVKEVGKVKALVDQTKESGVEKWRDLPELHQRVYAPLLLAFRNEMTRLMSAESDESGVCRKFVHFMAGKPDYYKVMAYHGKNLVVVQGYNFGRTLACNRPSFPDELISAALYRGTTVVFTFDGGWVLTMRIHTAESRITQSLKWDVRIIGHPSDLYSHHIML